MHNLAGNPIVRAAPIGLALKKLGFEIEVLGVIADDQKVYAPYADTFEYKTASRIRDLPKLATGNVIYAFKPLSSTLLPAMIAARFGALKPILLDVEDDDLRVCELSRVQRMVEILSSAIRSPKSVGHALTHVSRICCEAVTVSSTLLQKYYGGTKVLHGPDEKLFDPTRPELKQGEARRFFGLPENQLLVLFAGRPHAYKGMQEITEAVARTNSSLVLAGDREDPFFLTAKEKLGDKCVLIGLVDNQQMPRLLSAVDVVPVPQHDVAYTQAQLPAKLIEAMAMGKSVIVSDVGDLPVLIGINSSDVRGWVVRPNDSQGLADAIEAIGSSRSLVDQRNKNARTFYEQHASVSANAEVLRRIFNSNKRLRRFL